MDKIINILLLVIIFVFDPLAIALVVAANFAFDISNRKNLYGEIESQKDIFDEKNYKRYQDGKVISEDGWRFTNLGRLRVFSGDIKLTWKFKLDKQNVIVIKTKFQPLGKEYPFTYQLKDKFFEQLN